MTKRSKEFVVRSKGPVKGEPAVLSDPTSWCSRLLEDNGAGLHPTVRWGFYPGIGVNCKGQTARRQMYAACVCHIIMTAVEEHRISPTYTAIAEALNNQGVLTWSNVLWDRQKVFRLLKTNNLLEAVAQHRHVNNLAFTLRAAHSPTTTNPMTRWSV